ncbi:imidazole glycerol phosphate synthase subunit HisH [Formicincola oecophyllae]|uniref:Imidazole glycerol phosphate synthase subunit HisH n=1 Tax=Formicincola oecophyllae TaxID=2558361 RepID=A0A4Y6U9X8_9PROT|nr:imidazole glycerol phosphate synthase subunit HisH [Formicincola oecophyllae]QDH13237.1 imidazole glycerol phosphate synthase subunit HisH [Formicincola oecophyllae]
MRVVVIDYDGGNLASAAQAVRRAAQQAGLKATVDISRDPEHVASADRLILPGQGAFGDCMKGLEKTGLRPILEGVTAERALGGKGTPFLGICVGMQLMAESGTEHGQHKGLGWVKGHVKRMDGVEAAGLRLPHIGWNNLYFNQRHHAHPLLDGLEDGWHGYFVHSYALMGAEAAQCLASADYGLPIPAIVAEGCRAGTQFHVEKSQDVGLRFLGNFLRWKPGMHS